jgi:hypothetical protein
VIAERIGHAYEFIAVVVAKLDQRFTAVQIDGGNVLAILVK